MLEVGGANAFVLYASRWSLSAELVEHEAGLYRICRMYCSLPSEEGVVLGSD